MKSFYRMSPSDRAVLVAILLGALFVFLPIWKAKSVGGMSCFGWLMALFMVLCPVVSLVSILLEREK